MIGSPHSFFTVDVGESDGVEEHGALGSEGVQTVYNVNRIHLQSERYCG